MFFQDKNTPTGNEGALTEGSLLKLTAKAIKESIVDVRQIQKTLLEIDNQAKETSRLIFGTARREGQFIQEVFVGALDRTIAIGGTLEDQVSTYQAISKNLQRNVFLTEEQLAKSVMIQKTTGLAAEDVGKLVVGYQNLGQSTDVALESIDNLTRMARTYGLNVSTFLSSVGENIQLVNSYGFQDGVEGLGRMVARAQSLRMDFRQIKSLAADMLSPEKAIELAASMQTLGGAVGDLGDPFKLMYMAENDMEGLQNAVIDTAKSAVMFNEETGKFKITGVEMRRLREQASALGMDYEDLANTAVKAAKEQKVLEELDYTGLDDQTKQLVANLAEVGAGGEIKLNLPGFDEPIKDLSVLSDKQSKEYQALSKSVEDRDKSMEEISKEQLSLARQRGRIIEQISMSPILKSGGGLGSREGSGKELFELMSANIKGVADNVVTGMNNFSKENITAIKQGIGGAITGDLNMMATAITDLSGKAVESFDTMTSNLLTSIKLNLPATNMFKESVFKFDEVVTSFKKGLDDLFENLPGTGGITPTTVNDAIISSGNNKVLTFPEGALSFNNMDTIFAMTDPMGKNNNNQTTDNTPRNSELRINGNIRVDGLRGDTLGEILMNDPAFVAKIKDVITTSPNSSNQQYG
jgi:hypothetical protein